MTTAAAQYSSKDFDSLRLRVVALIRSVFSTWKEFQVVNFGNLLFEAWCLVGDGIAFNQNIQALESRIVTATQRRNLLALAQLFNYTPALPGAATVEETVTATGLTLPCTIAAGTVFKTEAETPVEFQSLTSVTLTPEAPTASVVLEHSKSQTQTYAGTAQADQTLQLSEPGFLDIVSVTGSLSGAWTRVEEAAFVASGPSDRVFTVSVDNNDRAQLSFGDGRAGRAPAENVTIVYKTGGGLAGNVPAHSIVKVDGTILDTGGNIVDLAVDNADGASGGAERETVEAIRYLAPISIRNPVTSVGREDFEDHAIGVPGVTRALMMNTDLDQAIERNSGRLYVVPTGTAPAIPFASSDLIEKVRRQFLPPPGARRAPYPMPQTFKLSVSPAVYFDLSFYVRLYLKRGADPAVVKARVMDALVAYFNPVLPDGTPNPTIAFGYYLRDASADLAAVQGQLPLSDVVNAIRDVEGVLKVGPQEWDITVTGRRVEHDVETGVDTTTVVVNAAHSDIFVPDAWFPRLRSIDGVPDVSLVNGDTSASL